MFYDFFFSSPDLNKFPYGAAAAKPGSEGGAWTIGDMIKSSRKNDRRRRKSIAAAAAAAAAADVGASKQETGAAADVKVRFEGN